MTWGPALWILLLPFAACSAEHPAGDGPGGDILLITIDTLRADHLGSYGYERGTTPGIDRWFQDGAVFERAYATEASTAPSVISILSGLIPQEHGVRVFFQITPKETALIPDLLPDEYETAAFVSNTVLTDEAIGIAYRFDHYDDFVDERESDRLVFERNARRTTDAALAWLKSDRDAERPLFLWVHYIDPHGPYDPPPQWKRSFRHEGTAPVEVDRILPFQRVPGIDDALEYVDLYDEEIAYMDAHVERLLEGYASLAEIDDALLILSADHGETMIEHESWFTHSYQVYEPIIRVPLLIRGPGVNRGRFNTLVSGVDLAPTLLRFAGVAPPDARPRPAQRGRGWRSDGLRRGRLGRAPVEDGRQGVREVDDRPAEGDGGDHGAQVS